MICATRPKVESDGRYTVTQTCSILGIHRNSLRKYTDAGLINCEFNKICYRKLYQGKEILRFWDAQI